jgi:hypothetical protein
MDQLIDRHLERMAELGQADPATAAIAATC